jgi:hypothetical protein
MARHIDDGYKSNPLLRPCNAPMQYTKAQIEEYIRCSEDQEYFILNYVKIINVDKGLIPFEMYPYQKRMVNTFAQNRFVITKMSRQSGKSTTVTSYLLWEALFKDNQNIAILANKGKLANDLLEKIKLAYQNLPKWLQQGVVSWNKGSIELENGSKIIAAATSSSAVRGGSFNILLLDEFAFIPRNIAEAFFTSVYPTISSGKSTKIIIVSTPYGMNHYYKMWMDAVEGKSDYVPLEIHWSETPGRDEKWKEETIRNTSEEQFRQEFSAEFLGSTNTLISPVKLREMAWTEPKKNSWGVDVVEDPVPNNTYVICVDSAHGVGLDYSAFSVIDVSQVPYKLVAKFRSNTASPMLYPEIIASTGYRYNNAFILAETNDIGMSMVEALQRDLEYENILMTVSKGRAGQKLSQGFGQRATFGLKMTKQVKSIGCSNIKDIIESNKLIIRDYDVIQELSTFIQVKQSYQAEDGAHDDMVMTLVMFGWLVRQPFFKELTNTDIRLKLAEERYSEIMEDLLPAGFVDDGRTDEAQSFESPRNGGFFDPFSY